MNDKPTASRIYQGHQNGEGLRVAIVQSRFNAVICDQLSEGARRTLLRQGVSAEAIDVVHCPGAFELAAVARRLSESRRYDAIVCVGAVVRGGTPHFDYVCQAAASGILQVALESRAAVTFGVLTTDNMQQAQDRAGGSDGNKGEEAALAALEMANLYRQLAEQD